jgi:hypothetical protein
VALDAHEYPTKIKLTKQQKVAIPIRRHEFHGDWKISSADSPRSVGDLIV